MMATKPKVLVVDDDAGIRETMTDILTLEGYAVQAVADGEAAVALCRTIHFDFALLDIRMPGMDGVETLRQIKALDATVRVIMITGYDVGPLAAAAMSAGAEAIFRKPLDVATFLPLLLAEADAAMEDASG
jgi:CheY-like chemotaxis protein